MAVTVAVAVAVIVDAPVIVAVHVNGNATVDVIVNVIVHGPELRTELGGGCTRCNFLDVSLTSTVAFPFTCTATITGASTATILRRLGV